MIDMVSYAKAFASPDGGDSAGIVRTLALARLNSTRRRIAGALADAGQEETARALGSFAVGTGSAWRPETGLALTSHRKQSHGLAALQLAAAYAGTGGSGQVESRLETPEWLYLDGWLTPIGGRCGLKSDGRSIVIDSDFGSATYLASSQNHWRLRDTLEGPWRLTERRTSAAVRDRQRIAPRSRRFPVGIRHAAARGRSAAGHSRSTHRDHSSRLARDSGSHAGIRLVGRLDCGGLSAARSQRKRQSPIRQLRRPSGLDCHRAAELPLLLRRDPGARVLPPAPADLLHGRAAGKSRQP